MKFHPSYSHLQKSQPKSVTASFYIRKCMNLREKKWPKTGLEPIDAPHLPNKTMKPIYHMKGIWMEFHPSYPYLTKACFHKCNLQFPY